MCVNAETFWVAVAAMGQCIEAMIVAVSAVALFWQIRRWKEEAASHKEIRVLQEELGSETFE